MLEVAPGVALLRVVLGIGGDLDEPVASFLLADERDQLARIAELAGGRGAARQVAAQRDEAADLLRAVGGEGLGDALFRRADAREVRRRFLAERGDVGDGGERLVARRAPGAVGDAEELGPCHRQLAHHGLQLLAADRRVRREELEAHRHRQAELAHVSPLYAPIGAAWMKNSRLPSPPAIVLSNQSSTARPLSAEAWRRRASTRA